MDSGDCVDQLTLNSTSCSSHFRDNRPGFNTGHRLPDSRVLLHVYRAIDGPVPHRGLVGPVDHVYLDLYSPGQDLVASILGYGLQPIALSLEVNNSVRGLVENVEISKYRSVETITRN